ncbi:MAG: 5-formyltetrahydrofolate cyclo-ligase [Rhodobacterales bacterium]|nr:MAG: 5-formyltetrahydrofolate cyclo-ligase [Rhodobacterales bacterium]
MSVVERKKALRKQAFAARAKAHAHGLDGAAQAHLAEALAPFARKILSGYMPIRTEINPLPVMAQMAAQTAIGLPIVKGADKPLRFRAWAPGCPLEVGPFGVQVPVRGEMLVPEVMILPLVAFDRRGGRLGYGGGYYDRTLERLRGRGPVTAIGFAYAAQELDTLPLEPTDQPLDMIVTDREVLRF